MRVGVAGTNRGKNSVEHAAALRLPNSLPLALPSALQVHARGGSGFRKRRHAVSSQRLRARLECTGARRADFS